MLVAGEPVQPQFRQAEIGVAPTKNPILLVKHDVGIEVVKSLLPRLVLTKERIYTLLLGRPNPEAGVFRFRDDTGVYYEFFRRLHSISRLNIDIGVLG